MKSNSLSELAFRTGRNRALQEAFGDVCDRDDLEKLKAATERAYRQLASSIPREPTMGARVMVLLSALTVSLYRAAREQGFDHAEAVSRTAASNWVIYRGMTDAIWKPTRLLSSDPLARVHHAMWALMKIYPYRKPGYDMDFVDAGRDTVGFDVRRCPAAEFFASQGLSDLCKAAFCDLDYPMADRWGVELDRELAISTGADHCNFRFRLPVAG
jgi:ubiquinone biosynthesis protein